MAIHLQIFWFRITYIFQQIFWYKQRIYISLWSLATHLTDLLSLETHLKIFQLQIFWTWQCVNRYNSGLATQLKIFWSCVQIMELEEELRVVANNLKSLEVNNHTCTISHKHTHKYLHAMSRALTLSYKNKRTDGRDKVIFRGFFAL